MADKRRFLMAADNHGFDSIASRRCHLFLQCMQQLAQGHASRGNAISFRQLTLAERSSFHF
jgi:hypothetical protein